MLSFIGWTLFILVLLRFMSWVEDGYTFHPFGKDYTRLHFERLEKEDKIRNTLREEARTEPELWRKIHSYEWEEEDILLLNNWWQDRKRSRSEALSGVHDLVN